MADPIRPPRDSYIHSEESEGACQDEHDEPESGDKFSWNINKTLFENVGKQRDKHEYSMTLEQMRLGVAGVNNPQPMRRTVDNPGEKLEETSEVYVPPPPVPPRPNKLSDKPIYDPGDIDESPDEETPPGSHGDESLTPKQEEESDDKLETSQQIRQKSDQNKAESPPSVGERAKLFEQRIAEQSVTTTPASSKPFLQGKTSPSYSPHRESTPTKTKSFESDSDDEEFMSADEEEIVKQKSPEKSELTGNVWEDHSEENIPHEDMMRNESIQLDTDSSDGADVDVEEIEITVETKEDIEKMSKSLDTIETEQIAISGDQFEDTNMSAMSISVDSLKPKISVKSAENQGYLPSHEDLEKIMHAIKRRSDPKPAIPTNFDTHQSEDTPLKYMPVYEQDEAGPLPTKQRLDLSELESNSKIPDRSEKEDETSFTSSESSDIVFTPPGYITPLGSSVPEHDKAAPLPTKQSLELSEPESKCYLIELPADDIEMSTKDSIQPSFDETDAIMEDYDEDEDTITVKTEAHDEDKDEMTVKKAHDEDEAATEEAGPLPQKNRLSVTQLEMKHAVEVIERDNEKETIKFEPLDMDEQKDQAGPLPPKTRPTLSELEHGGQGQPPSVPQSHIPMYPRLGKSDQAQFGSLPEGLNIHAGPHVRMPQSGPPTGGIQHGTLPVGGFQHGIPNITAQEWPQFPSPTSPLTNDPRLNSPHGFSSPTDWPTGGQRTPQHAAYPSQGFGAPQNYSRPGWLNYQGGNWLPPYSQNQQFNPRQGCPPPYQQGGYHQRPEWGQLAPPQTHQRHYSGDANTQQPLNTPTHHRQHSDDTTESMPQHGAPRRQASTPTARQKDGRTKQPKRTSSPLPRPTSKQLVCELSIILLINMNWV